MTTRAGRAYTAEAVTVYYDARRCIHYAACVRGLPQVFNPDERPWISAANADPEAIAAIVRQCPTGALHYALASGPEETPEAPTTVEARRNGPLFLRGDLVIRTASGELRDTRAALCRCGQSGNKPFCDGTHRQVGWEAEGVQT